MTILRSKPFHLIKPAIKAGVFARRRMTARSKAEVSFGIFWSGQSSALGMPEARKPGLQTGRVGSSFICLTGIMSAALQEGELTATKRNDFS